MIKELSIDLETYSDVDIVYDLLNCPRTDPLDCPYIALYTVLINRKGKVPEHPPC